MSGVGTEIARILAGPPLWIQKTAECSCQADADALDARGPDWCEAHMDQIVAKLRDEAYRRGIPFLDAAGRMLVRRAIANARRASARQA